MQSGQVEVVGNSRCFPLVDGCLLVMDSKEKCLAVPVAHFVFDQPLNGFCHDTLLFCKDILAVILTFVVKFVFDERKDENISMKAKIFLLYRIINYIELICRIFCSYLVC